MDLDSALRLFDALESDTEIEDNVVSVEPVISVPLNEQNRSTEGCSKLKSP